MAIHQEALAETKILIPPGNRSGKTTKIFKGEFVEQLAGYPDRSNEARQRAHALRVDADRLEYVASQLRSGAQAESHQKTAYHFRKRAERLERTLDPNVDQGYRQNPGEAYSVDAVLQEEIASCQRQILALVKENNELRKKLDVKESARAISTELNPGYLSALQRMELDLGRCRAYLGSKVFDEVVTGKRAAPEEPVPRQPWDWNEMRRMR